MGKSDPEALARAFACLVASVCCVVIGMGLSHAAGASAGGARHAVAAWGVVVTAVGLATLAGAVTTLAASSVGRGRTGR